MVQTKTNSTSTQLKALHLRINKWHKAFKTSDQTIQDIKETIRELATELKIWLKS